MKLIRKAAECVPDPESLIGRREASSEQPNRQLKLTAAITRAYGIICLWASFGLALALHATRRSVPDESVAEAYAEVWNFRCD